MVASSSRRSVAAGWAGLSGLVALSAGAASLLALRLLDVMPRSAEDVAAAPVERWIELAVLTAGALLSVWMLVGALAGTACAALARRRRSPSTVEALGTWAPGVVRRLARGAVGLGIGTGLALAPVAATADDAPPVAVVELGWQSTATTDADPATRAPERSVEAADSGAAAETVVPVVTADEPDPRSEATAGDGQDAERPLEARRTARTVTDDPQETPAPREVVVVRGDTLWDIAARTLPADAGDADILRETVRWHQANADVLGDDPDVILPGQVLRSP